MTPTGHHVVEQTIDRISSSDPIIKLLQEVKLGRMRATDAGLRAIAESWLDTYRQALEAARAAARRDLLRIDPRPRLALLIDTGVLPADHPGVRSLTSVFEDILAASTSASSP